MKWLLLFLVKGYQYIIHPLLPVSANCRFTPTCSCYAREALNEHHWLRASALIMYRLLRCHPFGGMGYDPVPPKDKNIEIKRLVN